MKRSLKMLDSNKNTCFFTHATHNIDCKKQSCKQWIKNNDSNNCVIIAAMEGPNTLQKVGQIFDLTRMRICQIEKEILDKLAIEINP